MRSLLKQFRSYLVAGTFVLLPVVMSVFILWKLFQWLDNVFPSMTGIEFPVMGLGVAVVLSIVMLTGIVAKNYIGKRLIELGNAIIVSIPILNKVFLAIQQIMDVMLKPQKNFLGEVVLVEYPKEDSWALGFVTSRETAEISSAIGEKLICVYVPTTPNPTSGFMLYVPESKAIKVNMSTEIAIKAIVSAGLVSSAKTDVLNTPEGNLADFIRKWKTRKRLKKMAMDPRD